MKKKYELTVYVNRMLRDARRVRDETRKPIFSERAKGDMKKAFELLSQASSCVKAEARSHAKRRNMMDLLTKNATRKLPPEDEDPKSTQKPRPPESDDDESEQTSSSSKATKKYYPAGIDPDKDTKDSAQLETDTDEASDKPDAEGGMEDSPAKKPPRKNVSMGKDDVPHATNRARAYRKRTISELLRVDDTESERNRTNVPISAFTGA